MKNSMKNTSTDYLKANIVFQMFECGKRGITRRWIEDLYEDEKGDIPGDKVILRIMTQIDEHLQPQSVRIVKKRLYGITRYFLEDVA